MDDNEKFWGERNLSLLFLKTIDIGNPLNLFNRSFAIAKYRDNYRPYTGRIGTNIANPIEEDVIEEEVEEDIEVEIKGYVNVIYVEENNEDNKLSDDLNLSGLVGEDYITEPKESGYRSYHFH